MSDESMPTGQSDGTSAPERDSADYPAASGPPESAAGPGALGVLVDDENLGDDAPEFAATDPAAVGSRGRGVELDACQFPGGCANVVEYAGTGRRPKYCYQVVSGVMHDRGNAKRVLDGGSPARRRGESDDTTATGPRPITRAQQTVQAQVQALAGQLGEVSEALLGALGNLADPDAVAAEIAAAARAARAQVDQAQAATDDARARTRAAEADADAARRSAASSDEEVEAALVERDAAVADRDSAIEDRERAETARRDVEAALEQLRAELEQMRVTVVEARNDRDRANRDTDAAEQRATDAATARDKVRAERDRLAGELATLTRAHTELTEDRDTLRGQVDELQTERDTARAETRAAVETARRDLDRAHADRDQARAEGAERGAERDTARDQAAEARTELAVAHASLAALREQLDRDVAREQAYARERLDDATARFTSRERELRAELDQLRTTGASTTSTTAPRTGTATDADDTSGNEADGPTSTPAPRRRGAPRAARRRPGPDHSPTAQPDAPGVDR